MNIQNGIILVYFLVAVNFLFNKMKDFSCHVQTIVSDNIGIKHGINILGVFFLLVLFTRSTPMHPWFLIGSTFVMYAFFMLITRCEYRFLGGFLVCMAAVFYLEASKTYKLSLKPENPEEIKKKYERMQSFIQATSVLIVVFGVIVYIGQHSIEYKRNWSWNTFLLGTSKCAGNGSNANENIASDIAAGVKRLLK